MGPAKEILVAILLVLTAGGAMVVAAPAYTPQRIFFESEGGTLIAMVADSPTWCGPEVTISVYGADESLFKEDRVDLQRLVGYVRAGMELDCPQATTLIVNGFVEDVFLYRGYAARDNRDGAWILVELPTSLVENPPKALPAAPLPEREPRPESLAECDRLAALPDDPVRPQKVAGVADDDMVAASAVSACEEALELALDDPRVRFQLARAYLMNDQPEEGLVLMTEAAEEGHGPAIAALADIALYGLIDDDPDPETAQALYQKAAEAGFKPATEYAKAIVSDPEVDDEVVEHPEPEYHHPKWAQLMASNSALASVRPIEGIFAYAAMFVGGMKNQCPDAGIPVTELDLLRSGERLMGGRLQVMMYMSAVGEGQLDALKQEAMDDGYALAFTKGCDSSEVAAARKSALTLYKS